MHAHVGGSGEFNGNSRGFHPVVAGARTFFFVPEFQRLYPVQAGGEEKIAQIRTAGPAQMGVAEAQDGRVRVVVAGAAVPAVGAGVRAQLYQTEGCGGTGIGVAVEICSVEDMNGINGTFLYLPTGCKCRYEQDRKRFYFHF